MTYYEYSEQRKRQPVQPARNTAATKLTDAELAQKIWRAILNNIMGVRS